MEIVYVGVLALEQVSAAIQESIDVIGLNVRSHIKAVHWIFSLLGRKATNTQYCVFVALSRLTISLL